MTRTRIAGTLAVLVLFVACSSDSKSSTSSSAQSNSGKALPGTLIDIEAAAEDVIDQLEVGGWTAIVKDALDMRAAWDKYKPQAAADGADGRRVSALDADLVRVSDSANAEDSAETAQAANDVSRELVELYALYEVGHPVQIGRLDVIGRQIVIDVDAGDLADAAEQVDLAAAEYGAIASDIESRGKDVAAEAEDALNALQAAADASDAATLVSEAKVFLEVVDDMERLY